MSPDVFHTRSLNVSYRVFILCSLLTFKTLIIDITFSQFYALEQWQESVFNSRIGSEAFNPDLRYGRPNFYYFALGIQCCSYSSCGDFCRNFVHFRPTSGAVFVQPLYSKTGFRLPKVGVFLMYIIVLCAAFENVSRNTVLTVINYYVVCIQ